MLKLNKKRKSMTMEVTMILLQLMQREKWSEDLWLAKDVERKDIGKQVPSAHSMGLQKRGKFLFSL